MDICLECHENATLTSKGKCICPDGFTGDLCTERLHVEVGCDPKCDGCFGETNAECESCVKNADFIKENTCE